MSAILSAVGTLALQGTTGLAGFALQNATPNIITYTAPNDGNMHRVHLFGELVVSSAQTGGAVSLTITDPTSTVRQRTIWAGGLSGAFNPVAITDFTIAPGTAVTLAQTSAQTAGAATVYAELWGS